MNDHDLDNIAEKGMTLANPCTAEKIVSVGKALGLQEGHCVLDLACGYGEMLALWAEHFAITGVGVDIREEACSRARESLNGRCLGDRIEIVCANAAVYKPKDTKFSAVAAIGASSVWGGYQGTLRATRQIVGSRGHLAIGMPYLLSDSTPEEYRQRCGHVRSEYELLQITRAEGFDFSCIVRASHEDQDRYEGEQWANLIEWIDGNARHPERQEAIDHLHRIQDQYLEHRRANEGWAIYVLSPSTYDVR